MRKAVEPVVDKTVLLSIHDVTPVHEDDIVRTCDLLTDMGISSLTLLVTPFYAMKKSNSFTKGSLFSEYLLSLDLEISLHGYSHFTKSGTMNEFSSMTSQKALTRLKDGIKLTWDVIKAWYNYLDTKFIKFISWYYIFVKINDGWYRDY